MKNRGRPAHEPTETSRRFVEALAGIAVSQAEIATALAITLPTLRKHYRRELDRGAATVEARLVGHLWRIAGGNDGTALRAVMFALRCRFGWSEFAPPPSR
ncbi:hypothetical protein [Mesorhizobium sp. M0571]|uniref:hypothetical protein n=1 Tax=Mesorhizobium sp. M0571 TaxID=2956960 RepID=UPI0033399332